MLFRRKLIYVQVHAGHLIASVVGEGRCVRRPCTALSHPRTLAGNFSEIVECLQAAFRELSSAQMRVLKPHVLVHLVPKVEGGHTNVELRAFKEAAEAAGAHMGWLLDGKNGPLSDDQVEEVFATVR